MAELKLITLTNLTTFANEIKTKYTKQSDYETLKAQVQELEEASGERNKIEVVKVNGSALPIASSDRSVDIKVPEDLSDLNNDQEFQTKTQVETAINSKLSSTYKPAGSAEPTKFAAAPSADEVGNVYNASDPFTTNSYFVETGSHSYPAGTNVVAVQADDAYKWDVLSGFVDLSEYAKSSAVTTEISSAISALNITDYAKTSEMESYVGSQLEDYYNSSTIDSKLNSYVLESSITDVVRNDALESTLTAYVKTSDISTISDVEIKNLLADA